MASKEYPNTDYQKVPLTRRDWLLKTAAIGSATAAATYTAFAPSNWPFSLKDLSGLRGQPQEPEFLLPDYRIAKREGKADVGIGRSGDVDQKLRKALDAVGGLTHFIRPGDIVLVKPNVAFDRAPILGATTHPDILEVLIRMLLVDARAKEVRVADNPIESPADCFAKTGIRQAAEKGGARVYLPDSNAFQKLYTPGAKLIERWTFFERPFRNVNKVIGIAPVKDHNLCFASMGIKNWYGLLGGRRNQFHQAIHDIVAELSIMIRPTLTILDGTQVLMANGPTGGDPAYVKNADTVAIGVDPVALDAWAYEHLLERTDSLPEYLHKAEAKGSGGTDYRGRVEEIV